MRRSTNRLLLALLALIALGFWSQLVSRPAASGLVQLAVLDIGQGDALIVTTPLGRQILVDAGPDDAVTGLIDRRLSPARRELELVVASHNHSDHIGGMGAVLSHLPVRSLWISGAIHTSDTYLGFLDTANKRQVPTTVVTAGTSTTLDGVRCTVLYPLIDQRDARPENQHDASVVVLVEYGERSFLLTGDLESEHEAEILESGQLTHPVDVLKVGHHGSNTSTSEAWLDALKPSIAIISVGRDNQFHHPHPTTLERLGSRGIETYRTDTHGTVTILSDGHRIWTETER